MSSINGIFERCGANCSDTALLASLEALNDYGENGKSKWIYESVGLGNQRTNLFYEPRRADFPYHDIDAGIVITADARIDNRSELCGKLNISKNAPDSQVIISAWQKWQSDCPAHLIGDYAFALWDARQKILFCARDHVGTRPFYYSLSAEKFVFATDIKAVLAVPGISDRLDEEYVKASLNDKFFYHNERTYLAEVRLLPPGHTLTVCADSEKLQKYWFPENAPNVRFSNDADYAEAALEIYSRSVADRLLTTEKVGIHLTGGLDSSSIAVLTARDRHQKNLSSPAVFCWQSLPTNNSKSSVEHKLIDAVCDQENLIPQYCPISVADVLSVLRKDPTIEPIDNTLMLETVVQRSAEADGVRLILSGWGGDESLSFNGNGYYAELLLRGRWWRLFRESRKFGSAAKFIAKELFLLCFSNRTDGLSKLENLSFRNPRKSDPIWLKPKFRTGIKLKDIPSRQSSPRTTLLWLWKIGFHAERMESWAAHGAAHGITYAYPMLDRRLMEFVIGLPPEQFICGKWNRWIMRKTVEQIVPAEVCWNTCKDEPLRVEQTLAAIYEALDTARRQIIEMEKLPKRAEYLSIDELLDYLQPENLARRPKQGNARRALQFLDF